MTREDLMQLLDFQQEDLDSNRHGRISEYQMLRLNGHFKIISILVAGWMCIMVLLAGKIFLDELTFTQVEIVLLAWKGAFLIVVVAGVALVGRYVLRLHWDIVGRQVSAVDGRVRLARFFGQGRIRIITVSGVTFPISLKVYRQLEGNNIWRIYFLPRSKKVVSIELL